MEEQLKDALALHGAFLLNNNGGVYRHGFKFGDQKTAELVVLYNQLLREKGRKYGSANYSF